MAESKTAEGTPVRFTRRGDCVYAMVIGTPHSRRISFSDVDGSEVPRVRLVGHTGSVEWGVDDGLLSVVLPERLPPDPVVTFDLGAGLRAGGDRRRSARRLPTRSSEGLGARTTHPTTPAPPSMRPSQRTPKARASPVM